MDDYETIFPPPPEGKPDQPPRRKPRLPTFTPFIILALILVGVWAWMTFVLPPPPPRQQLHFPQLIPQSHPPA